MIEIIADALFIVQSSSPYRTGRLSRSFQANIVDGGFDISTDVDYMQYTEETWTFNRRWGKTLQNPNQGWFEEASRLIAEGIAVKLGGTVNVAK